MYNKKGLKHLLLLALFMMSMASCQQQGTDFQKMDLPEPSLSNPDKNGEGDIPPNEVVDPIVNIVSINCQNAANEQRLEEFVQQVYFPAAIECNFNEGGMNAQDLNAEGNGPRQDGKVRARIEQSFNVPLPDNAKVCDVDFNFPTQTMEYDDEIFLLLNNFVLMSSTNYATNSGSSHYVNGLQVNSNGLQIYKWNGPNSLYDLHYGQGVTPRYCYGLDASMNGYNEMCNLPFTQQLGQIKLDIPQEKIIELGVISDIMQSNSAQKSMNFGFVSTGDNDNGDCEHSAFGFSIQVKYYIPE